MPPKPKYSREDIIETAMDIIRDSSPEMITAQEIGRRMGSSSRPMFTWFNTLEELRAAAKDRAWEIYDGYVERGLEMTPAFKGFAMAYVRFASREPSLFRLLFMRKAEPMNLLEFLNREGHLEAVRKTIMETFRLGPEEADRLYENLWIYVHGIATLLASGAVQMTDGEIAGRLGTICRGMLITLRLPEDARTGIMPDKDTVVPGTVEDYLKTI